VIAGIGRQNSSVRQNLYPGIEESKKEARWERRGLKLRGNQRRSEAVECEDAKIGEEKCCKGDEVAPELRCGGCENRGNLLDYFSLEVFSRGPEREPSPLSRGQKTFQVDQLKSTKGIRTSIVETSFPAPGRGVFKNVKKGGNSNSYLTGRAKVEILLHVSTTQGSKVERGGCCKTH